MVAPRVLVVEGNVRATRERSRRHGMTTGGDSYRRAILRAFPDVAVDIVCPADADAALPAGVALVAYHGAAFGGSALHAYDDTPEVTRQRDLMRAVLAAGVPVLGSCWGLQVAAIVAGGAVEASPLGREIGVARKIALTQAGRGHPMYEGKASVFDSLCVHFDEVTQLPPGAVVLARNGHSDVQAACFEVGSGSFWGVQYHPEFDLGYFVGLFDRDRAGMVKLGFGGDDRAVEDIARHYAEIHAEPERKDLAWKLGMDADVLDPAIREREIANWLFRAVLPRLAA